MVSFLFREKIYLFNFITGLPSQTIIAIIDEQGNQSGPVQTFINDFLLSLVNRGTIFYQTQVCIISPLYKDDLRAKNIGPNVATAVISKLRHENQLVRDTSLQIILDLSKYGP
jgi:hypothetical protein